MSFYNRIKLLRIVGISEGISFLILILIAMPLKYYFGYPLVVKYVGWLHGLLFIGYIAAVILAITPMRWKFFQVLVAFAASLLPLGTFLLDRSLRKREHEIKTQALH